MSVSAVAPTPFYQDPDRLQIGLPQTPAEGGKAADSDDKNLSMFADGDESPSFWDLLDVINPLQHIPIVNDIYRDLTGDKIGVGARLAGGTLFGGVIGLVASAADCVFEEGTGKNMGDTMLALFQDDAPADAATQLASNPVPVQADVAAVAAAAPSAVASSPAKGAAAEALAIALPDDAAGAGRAGYSSAGAGQPMMFTADGVGSVVKAAPAPAAVSSAPMVIAAAAPAAAKTVASIGDKAPRFMPTPTRALNSTPAPLPEVTVPVANGSSRSNVPITGRAPNAANAAAVQRALAGQEVPANHPMLPPTDANGQTAASPDWFTAAWGQALDKYERANQLKDKPATGGTLE